MAINPSIPLQSRPYQDQTLDTVGTFLAFKDREAQRQRQAEMDQRQARLDTEAEGERAYQRKQRQDADERAGKVRDVWAHAIDPQTGRPDYKKAAQSLAGIDPKAAIEAWDKLDVEEQKKVQEEYRKNTEIAAMAESVLSAPVEERPGRYMAARALAIKKGLANEQDIPPLGGPSQTDWTQPGGESAYASAPTWTPADQDRMESIFALSAGFKGVIDRATAERKAKADAAKAEKVTFKNPETRIVDGKRMDVVQGSDNNWYLPGSQTPIDAARVKPVPEKPTGEKSDTEDDKRYNRWVAEYNRQIAGIRSRNQDRATSFGDIGGKTPEAEPTWREWVKKEKNVDLEQAFPSWYGKPPAADAGPTAAPARPAAAAAPAGDKTVTTAELTAIAKRRGTTVEQEKQRAAAAGYTVR